MATVTREMVQAVREHECQLEGHTFSVACALGIGPTHVICDRCGKSWRVERDESVTPPA